MKTIVNLLAVLTFLLSTSAFANNETAVLEQAQKLGAPMLAVQRAIKLSHSSIFPKKDVVAVFDLSQRSAKKRFYVLDFAKGKTSAYVAAHGRGNGDNIRASNFKGFATDFSMTPLGPLRTGAAAEGDPRLWSHYTTIVGKYDGKVYRDLVILRLEGTTRYNDYINKQKPTFINPVETLWIVHPSWYTAPDYQRNNPGLLGRSLGCIALDPVYSNEVAKRLQGGALIYVTVGDDPIEKYL